MAAAATLADSIASFSKSSLKIVKELEKQLAKASADIRDARTERDNAIEQTRTSQAEVEIQKKDILQYKSSLAQAERTIEEQTGALSRLYREANHWKEQARNWQEHFTRVEEERCSLATTLEEMLAGGTQAYGPILPTHLFPDIEASKSAPIINQTLTPSVRSKTKKHTTGKVKPPKDSSDVVPETPSTPVLNLRTVRSRNKAKSDPANKSALELDASTSTGNGDNPAPDRPMSRLVRRVQAIIHVKSEEEDELEPLSSLSDSNILSNDDYEPAIRMKPKRSTTTRNGKQTVLTAEGCLSEDAPKSAPLPGKKNKSSESDGDDELMLGANDSGQITHPNTDPDPPTKKRRLNDSTRHRTSKRC